MRTRVTDGTEARNGGAKAVPPSRTRDRSAAELNFDADGACNNLALLFAPVLFHLTATIQKEQVMSRKPNSLGKQLIVATALALGASSLALADDNSMGRFGGDSYAYFNQPAPRNTAAGPTWRQSHPNGLSESELQALSASDLSASVAKVNPPVFASAPADPSWRRSHPNGLTEPEMEALSSSSLAMWQNPNGSRVATDQSNVAQSPNKETFSARLARFFHPGTQASSN
jgi:hypothetical protein